MYYIGLDVHKKTISYCVKDASGRIHTEGKIPATRLGLDLWMKTLPQPWTVAMEATMFTGWIYDHLLPHAAAVKVAHPLMLRAIAAAKKRTLRYRNLLVRQTVQLKNKISGLLMEAGVSYNKQKLHKVGYFRELLKSNPDIDESLRPLLQLCRETLVRLQKIESGLVRSLARDPLLVKRVERLMTIPAVGPITALTWALELGDVSRFSSIKKAISYCGLCSAEKSSADNVKRTPISKQRNKHLQCVLVEAAKMAPRLSPELALLYDRAKQKGNANRATLAVARKLVAYLVAIDRRQKDFLVVEKQNRAAA
jgi:transposase